MSEDVPLEPIEFFGPEVTFNWSYEEAPVPQFELEFFCGIEPNINVVRKIVENQPDRIDEETKRRHYSVLLTQAENRGNRSHPSRHIKVRVRAIGPTGAPYSEWLERVGHNKPPKLVPVPTVQGSFENAVISITEPDVPDRVAYRIHRTLSPTEPLSAANMVSQGPDTNVSIDLPKNGAGENPDYFFPIAAIDSFGPDELDWVVIGPVARLGLDHSEVIETVNDIINPQLGAINANIDAANTARENAVNTLNGQLTVINGKLVLVDEEFGEIGSRFVTLETKTDNQATKIGAMETVVGTTDGLGLRARLLTAEQTITDLETEKASASSVSSLSSEINTARNGKTTLAAELGSMRQTVTDGLAGKASSVDLTNLTARVSTTETTNTAQNTRLSTVEADVADKASASDVNSLKTEVQTARNGKATLGAELTAMRTATSDGLAGKASASDLSALVTRVSNTETTNTSQNTRLNTVENDLAGKASASSVTTLQSEITTARGGTANLAARFTAVNQTIVDGLAGKASASSVSSLSSTVGTYDARITTAQTTAADAAGAVAAKLSVLLGAGNKLAGYQINATTTNSSFEIIADNFRLTPSNGAAGVSPFEVIGSTVYMKNTVWRSAATGARTEQDANGMRVYDASRLRVRVGIW